MNGLRVASVAGAFVLVGAVAACGSSTSSTSARSNPQVATIAQGNYDCHDLVFAGQHPTVSFPQLTLKDGKYTVGGHLGGTYTARSKGKETRIALSGGLLGGSTARYDTANREVTFGGPSQLGNVIADAPGLVCSLG